MQGFDVAKAKALEVLDEVKIGRDMTRETLISVANSSLGTKLSSRMAKHMSDVSCSNIWMLCV